jgi:hypothetical protein
MLNLAKNVKCLGAKSFSSGLFVKNPVAYLCFKLQCSIPLLLFQKGYQKVLTEKLKGEKKFYPNVDAFPIISVIHPKTH